jgi:hypothetical protein
MARSDSRYSVYPAPKAVEVVGNSAPALNQAIACWAALQARAMADNARTFHDVVTDEDGYVHESLHEWGVLAEIVKEIQVDPEFANPGILLATAVEDAYRLDTIRGQWFHMQSRPDEHSRVTCVSFGWKESDSDVAALVAKLRELDYSHAWAVILAVQWYWDHEDENDPTTGPWWTLTHHRRWHERQRSKVDTREPQHSGARKNKKAAAFGRSPQAS